MIRQKTKFKRYKLKGLRSQKGIAYVEMLPLLVLFVMLFGLSFGLWTSIHRATLKTIAARHYSFEVLNNRSHYIYHRDTISADNYKQYYSKDGMRFFANVIYWPGKNPQIIAEKKPLSLFNQGITKINSPSSDNSSITKQTNPIKIKIGYGICIDAETCKKLPP